MATSRKQIRWLHEHIVVPPFTEEGQYEAGTLLRLLQEGEAIGMPSARAMPTIGSRCGELRVRDAGHNWRIVYRADDDFIVVVDIYAKTSTQSQDRSIERCRERLARYDADKAAANKRAKGARQGKK